MFPGAVAQLGERLVRNEEVDSSILFSSTKLNPPSSILGGPRPNFLDHQEGVINGRQSGIRQGEAGGEPLRSSRRQGAAHGMLLLKGPAARVENP